IALAKASEARVQSLIQSQEAVRRTVMENIQTQYQQFISARDQELSLTAAVAGAQIVLNSYRRQFIAGRKSWLE
ncbi:TolC family protein, partial [Streptococcus pneumoniae]